MKLNRAVSVCFLLAGVRAEAGDVVRQVIMEADPVAPASSAYEQSVNGVTTSKYGAAVDFNMGATMSTGPEFWTGTFLVRGNDSGSVVRREDLWPGERQKIDAMRLRWTFGIWEQGQSMRGWYFKAAYNWTKINSRANRYTEDTSNVAALASTSATDQPNDETDLITDMRHGVSVAFGNRWFVTDRLVATIGSSLTHNVRRTVIVDSKDSMAKADYEALINNTLPDTRMAVRPIPEVNMGVGYSW